MTTLLERGTAKLLRERWAAPMPDDAIETVLRAVEIEGSTVNDIFCLGIPSPEFVTGTVTVKRDNFDRIANNLLNLKACRLLDMNAFPCGIPELEAVRVDFRIGR